VNAFTVAATALLLGYLPLGYVILRRRPLDGVVALELLCCVGVVAVRTTYDRLHYAAAGATVPAFCILAAVLVREQFSSGGLAGIAAVGLMFVLSPVALTATARAVRRVEKGE
jgi:multisubunit Na+/H+ antiporter MnhG subunit